MSTEGNAPPPAITFRGDQGYWRRTPEENARIPKCEVEGCTWSQYEDYPPRTGEHQVCLPHALRLGCGEKLAFKERS